MENEDNIQELYRKFLENTISEKEYQFLLDYFNTETYQKDLKSYMMLHLQGDNEADNTYYIHRQKMQQIKISVKDKLDKTLRLKNTRIVSLKKKKASKLLPYVAAAIFIFFGFVSYRFLLQPKQLQSPLLTNKINHDIAPGSDKAILKLANGQKIELNNTSNGVFTHDGHISYLDGAPIDTSRVVQTVTVSTPLAGQYQVELPDGTKAWLNAGSSISYPTRFVDKKRKISITGEVYLKVAKNPKQPFVVITAQQEIEVLGTTFDLNTYGDNNKMYTTLIEGSLKVTHTLSGVNKILKPGEQAILSAGSNPIYVKKVDVDDVTSWKDGFYIIDDQTLALFSKQIERWYDVSIDMQDKGNIRISAIIPRTIPLSEVLLAIEIKTGIKFIIQGRRVIAK